jgi:hypothetical protein
MDQLKLNAKNLRGTLGISGNAHCDFKSLKLVHAPIHPAIYTNAKELISHIPANGGDT